MFYTIKENTEAYRSGHNEAVLKTVWAQAHGGSSPSASAKAKKPRIVCGIFCVLAEETEMKRFLVAYCRRKADIRRGSRACEGNGVILSDNNEKALRYLSPRIVCGIFCVLAEGTELKRFLMAYCRR